MANNSRNDNALRAVWIRPTKVRAYIKRKYHERLKEDAHTLGMNVTTLLECALIRHLEEEFGSV